jgi:hypothetical protein
MMRVLIARCLGVTTAIWAQQKSTLRLTPPPEAPQGRPDEVEDRASLVAEPEKKKRRTFLVFPMSKSNEATVRKPPHGEVDDLFQPHTPLIRRVKRSDWDSNNRRAAIGFDGHKCPVIGRSPLRCYDEQVPLC